MKLRNKMGIVFFIIIVLIILIDILTLHRYKFNTVSGNGNPGLVPIFLIILVLLWFSFNLINLIANTSFGKFNLIILFIVILPVTIFLNKWAWYHQCKKLMFIKEQLIEKNIPIELVSDITSGISIYTNTVYFNYITLLMFLSIVISFGLIIALIKKI
ncbi:MAG: hypothetical protein VR72_12360 [Clostridiaceae bacterium BRH_c20a]|nr:MAG: hypothetical protein VR72_12360 [Clostridiaceae bacterium BRH_c20a]